MKDKRILILFLTVFIDLVGFGIVIPMSPYLAKSFGASALQVGLLMAVYSFAQFLFSPFWGQLSDRIGRRPVILVSLVGAGLSHIGFAFAPSFTGLMVARTLAGLFGGNISAAMAYIADITGPKNRSQAMGLIGAAFGLGFICGPALGGSLSDVGNMFGEVAPFGSSFPALIAGAICLANAFSAYFFLPESFQPGGAVRKIVRWAPLVEALRTPKLNVILLLLFINTFALAHVEATLFLYVQQQFGWTLTQASFGFAYIGVIMVITQGYLIRKMLPKLGERRVLLIGFCLSAFGFALCAVPLGLWTLAIGVTGLGLGNGLSNPALNGSVSLLTGSESQGHSLGASQSLASLARILGPPTGGFLFQTFLPTAPFLAAAGVIGIGLMLALSYRQSIPTSAKASAA